MTPTCNACKHFTWDELTKYCRAWDAPIGDLWDKGCDQYLDAYAKTHIYVDGRRYAMGDTK